MNNPSSLEERLARLGQELSAQRSLAPRIMEAVSTRAEAVPRTAHAARGVYTRRGVLGLLTAAAAAMVLVVWMWRPGTLYARALDALSKAQTVHVTGWTTRVVRKWPLEEAADGAAPKKQSVNAWYWRDANGTPRSYEKFGPVIQVRDGETLKEYQQDVDLLFIAEGMKKDYLEMFSTVAEYLRLLEREGMQKEHLGIRQEEAKKLRGLRITHAGRTEEYWFDVKTDLPHSFSRTQQEEDGVAIGFEMRFRYDEPVPIAIANYAPPKTDNIRYGHGHENVELAWRRHVQDIGVLLQEQPIEGPIAILPRKGQETFAHQWTLQTPDGKYWVLPLDLDPHFPLTVKNLINLPVATPGGDRAHETWRVSEDLLDVEFPRGDLVYAEGTPWQAWVQYVLNQNGLEYVDVVEERRFWIAHHDGRDLMPWHTVNPPVPYIVEGGVEKKGVVKPGVGHQLAPETMQGLFEDFNRLQNINFSADHPIIIDETGLPSAPEWDRQDYPRYDEYRKQVLDKYFVASDSPWFAGEESRQMARDWFKKEFGVTFTEEKRPMTIHVVRRMQ